MQQTETLNIPDFSDISRCPEQGRIISLDLGTKKVGMASCDVTQTVVKPHQNLKRTAWKLFLLTVKEQIKELDAVALVLGLPINLNEPENEMFMEAKRLARNFSLSLDIPVFLQDERATSLAASENLYEQGIHGKLRLKRLDSEAACLILVDFLDTKNLQWQLHDQVKKKVTKNY
jgi:putative holliday junction resolvase